MTSERGVFEHAEHATPRVEHGYCVDDVARALVVTVREPAQTAELRALTDTYLAFLEGAVTPDGRVHNRMNDAGDWTDQPTTDDWWGRAIMGLGFVAARAHQPFHRTRATYAFLRAAVRRSFDVRASSFAAVGAADLLRAHPAADAARRLLEDAIEVIPRAPSGSWEWPEARLRYANATLCEALIAGGEVLDRPELLTRGLELLGFLLDIETASTGWLSVTGSAGRGPGEAGPLWDQQAIEPSAIADACLRAYEATGDLRWRAGVRRAWGWFRGENDSGTPMYDVDTGAGYDGLTADGRNENRGAESTIAALSTMQHAHSLGVA